MGMELDRGPMAVTNEKLDQVLLELYSLNLTIRDLLIAEKQEAQPPVIQVTSPEVDLTPLAQALGNVQPQVDLEALYAALAGLAAQNNSTVGPEILAALAALKKELSDLGVGMRAIAAGSSMGGGGAVHLSTDSQVGVLVQNPTADPIPVEIVAGGTGSAGLTDTELRAAPVDVAVTGTVTTGGLTNAELRASSVPVRDDFTTGEVLADQPGADAVLTFSFSAPVHMVWVRDIGATTTNVSRADPFGGTPTSSVGIAVPNGEPTPITVTTSTVKVYAPTGSTICVYGYRR